MGATYGDGGRSIDRIWRKIGWNQGYGPPRWKCRVTVGTNHRYLNGVLRDNESSDVAKPLMAKPFASISPSPRRQSCHLRSHMNRLLPPGCLQEAGGAHLIQDATRAETTDDSRRPSIHPSRSHLYRLLPPGCLNEAGGATLSLRERFHHPYRNLIAHRIHQAKETTDKFTRSRSLSTRLLPPGCLHEAGGAHLFTGRYDSGFTIPIA
uniref:Uncharacterized protein n=1 Tax=Panagrellus redivivus TaxID=6233 RepID=A0A7E4V2U2_PANRE